MKLRLTPMVAGVTLLAVAAVPDKAGASPDEHQARALELAKESDLREFSHLVDEWANQKQYALLAGILPDLAEATPEASSILVRELLDAPAGTEFGPDIAEALIQYLDQSERIKGGGDEVATGRMIVGYRIVVLLESSMGIPADDFDYESPRRALKYVDDARQMISKFRAVGETFPIAKEGTGSASFRRAWEMISANHTKEPTRNPSRESMRPPATASSRSLPAEVSSSNGSIGTGWEGTTLQKWWAVGGVLVVLLATGWYFARRKKGA